MIIMMILQQLPVIDEEKLQKTTDSLKTVTEQVVTVLKYDP